MIQTGTYKFTSEFLPMIGVSKSTYLRRKEEVLEWLKDFFDYEIKFGRPTIIVVKEVYGEYQPLPRKSGKVQELREEKLKDYADFIDKSIGTEWKLTSKMKESRDAIAAFGNDKYGHTNAEGVSKRYVGPAMNEKCEKDNTRVWVDYETYKPIDDETLKRWREILTKHKVDEKKAGEYWLLERQGVDTSEQKQWFQNARNEFLEEFGIIPILVSSWRKVVQL